MLTSGIRHLVWLTAALGLAGCATPQGTANAEASYSPVKRASGMLAASVTVSGYAPGNVWIQLLARGGGGSAVSIPVNAEAFGLDWNPGSDASGRSFRGRIAAIELAPGDYELGRWVMNVGNTATYVSSGRIGSRASVKAGEVVYIGNIHIDIQRSAGNSLPGRVNVTDEAKRDLPLLVRKYPALRVDGIRVMVENRAEAPGEPAPRVRIEDLDGLLRR